MATGISLSALLEGALLFAPDNVTPLSRTPWAGRRLGRGIKAALVQKYHLPEAIGEAWELSCDPAFPSRLAEFSLTLPELIAQFPDEILSPRWRFAARLPHWRSATALPGCNILVKLLDAAQVLSLQVHPADDDAHLAMGECGKPEGWLILETDPGAGIYLGFQKTRTREALRELLRSADAKAVRAALQFVPVHPGEYFDIPPGTPHAIGPGVLLLEVQRILPQKSGKTYRLYDWNRRYTADGGEDPTGSPRELHLDAALPLVNPEQQVGSAYVDSLRRAPRRIFPQQGLQITEYPAADYCRVQQWQFQAQISTPLALERGYACIICLSGTLELCSRTNKKTPLMPGWSALLPHCAGPFTVVAQSNGSCIVITP